MPFDVSGDGVYRGDKEKLVICIDVGTTASAVSYAHLVPGAIPKPETVSQWPSSANEMKVPSAVYYLEGKPKAFCAETEDEFIKVQAETGDWQLVKEFKLLLHPSSMQQATVSTFTTPSVDSNFELPVLPSDISLVQVYSDLYKYLVQHTGEFYRERTLGGSEVWDRLLPSATFIIPHPDGWRDAQQLVLRQALAASGLIEGVGSKKIEFVRESEASVHWVLSIQHSPDTLKKDSIFTIVDAGGSTVDTAMLQVDSVSPKLQLRETKGSECIQAGGLFVTRAGKRMIKNKLAGSHFNVDDLVSEATSYFESTTKRKFVGNESSVLVKLGVDATEKSIGLRKGRLSFEAAEVGEQCFEPFVQQILASVERQTRIANKTSSHILLVGGFGESPYLKSRLKDFFEAQGISVVVTTEPTKKAVSEGGVIYYLKKSVVARAVRSTYGIPLVYPYNTNDDDHLSRGHVILPDRSKAVRGGFSTLVGKDTVVGTEEVTVLPYSRFVQDKSSLANFEVELYAYDGQETTPKWLLDPYGNVLSSFIRVGTIKADLSPVFDLLTPRHGAGGDVYWKVEFSIGVSFGTNSLKAKLLWNEGVLQREGPATIILDALQGIGSV